MFINILANFLTFSHIISIVSVQRYLQFSCHLKLTCCWESNIQDLCTNIVMALVKDLTPYKEQDIILNLV